MPPAFLLLQEQRGRSASMQAVDENQATALSSPPLCTPPIQMASMGFNPRSRLLRRSSSSSTCSMTSSEDEAEPEWSEEDLGKLQSVYEQVVDEASLDTPFIGVPPSQLLHTIARACRRVYRDDWKFSISQTRSRALAMAKERLAASEYEGGDVQATPRPGCDFDATPKRRKLRRHDSMDFLPFTRNLESVEKLFHKLHQSSQLGSSIFFSSRNRTDTSSSGSDVPMPHTAPLAGRLARSMTFTSLANDDDIASYHQIQPHSQHTSRPVLRTGSGFIASHSLSHQATRPSLYTSPSFAGSTDSMRMQDEVNSTMYGSSFASTTSFMSNATSTAASSALDGSEASFTRSRKRTHKASSTAFAPSSYSASSVASSHPSADWSASSTNLSVYSDGPTTPSPCPSSQHPHLSNASPQEISYFSHFDKPREQDERMKSPVAPRSAGFLSGGKGQSGFRLADSWLSFPGKGQAAPEQVTLESPFEVSFGHKKN